MSRQGWLPSWVGRVNPRTRTPLHATFMVTGAVLLFALWLPLIDLAILSSFITLVVFALVNFALWRLKAREPVEKDIFTIPYWVPVIGFFTSSGFLAYQLFYVLVG